MRHFEDRWRVELNDALAGLEHGRLVAEVLEQMPDYHEADGQHLLQFTLDHVYMLHRLLIATIDERNDISSEEARGLYGAYDKLKINFQDAATPTPEGWLRDVGEVFADRGNGQAYGWKCDVSAAVLNTGAENRGRTTYTVLENTLVATDPHSTCDGQEWRIRLAPGRYRVEVFIQDTQFSSFAAGCMLQGENLGFPEVVGPLGRGERRELVIDVIDHLSLSADFDTACATVNRITIQDLRDAGVVDYQMPPSLSCGPVPGWCPAFPAPAAGSLAEPLRFADGRPLGEDGPDISCNDGESVTVTAATEYSSGSHRFCGSRADGQAGLWRQGSGDPKGGGGAVLPLTCGKPRNWCPHLQPPAGAAILSMEPPTREIGSKVRFACLKGYLHTGGALTLRCTKSQDWCPEVGGGSCGSQPTIQCELMEGYCPELRSLSGERQVAAGLMGADEREVHDTPIVSTILPLGSGRIGETKISSCPNLYSHVYGDAEKGIVCTQGDSEQGVWQPLAAATTRLVDAAVAEPLVCEFETIYGVRRKYSVGLDQLPAGSRTSGVDVIPNINQRESAYDAVDFETHLRPFTAGVYTLTVEVVGSFFLSLAGSVLLKGRSQGVEPQVFSTQAMELEEDYYELGLQYILDPNLTGLSGDALYQRHVRLLWRKEGGEQEVVPATAMYHTFENLHGFPKIVIPVNDPNPCVSKVVDERKTLRIGDSGLLFDGSPDRDYNPNLVCRWWLQAVAIVQFRFIVNFFDIEKAEGCAADRVEFRAGTVTTTELVGSFCGNYPQGHQLMYRVASDVFIDFVTDNMVEMQGFNITYVVESEKPPGAT